MLEQFARKQLVRDFFFIFGGAGKCKCLSLFLCAELALDANDYQTGVLYIKHSFAP